MSELWERTIDESWATHQKAFAAYLFTVPGVRFSTTDRKLTSIMRLEFFKNAVRSSGKKLTPSFIQNLFICGNPICPRHGMMGLI
jgi:hypothetical protein